MFYAIVWAQDQATASLIQDEVAETGAEVLDCTYDIKSPDEFKTIMAIKALNSILELKTGTSLKMTARLAFSEHSDKPEASAKLADIAALSMKNAERDESVIGVYSEKNGEESQVVFVGHTSTLSLEAMVTPELILDKASAPGVSLCQIKASAVREMVGVVTNKICSRPVLRYADLLLAPDVSGGVSLFTFVGKTTISEEESENGPPRTLPEDGDAGSIEDSKDFIVTFMLGSKVLMENNTAPRPRLKAKIWMPMIRGLKNKIKMISRMSSDINLTIKLDDSSQKDGYVANLWVVDNAGTILSTELAHTPSSLIPDDYLKSIGAGINITLDGKSVSDLVSFIKGDIQIGLGSSLVLFKSEGSAATTIAKQKRLIEEYVVTPDQPLPVTIQSLQAEEPQAEEPQAEEPQAEEPQAEEPQAEEPVPPLEKAAQQIAQLERQSTDISLADREEALSEGDTADEGLDIPTVLEELKNDELAFSSASDSVEGDGILAKVVGGAIQKTTLPEVPIGLLLREKIGECDVITVRIAEPVGEYFLAYSPDLRAYVRIKADAMVKGSKDVGEGCLVQHGSARHRIIEVLLNNPGTPLSYENMILLSQGALSEYKKNSMKALLAVMAKEGMLERAAKGKYTLNPLARFIIK